MIDPYREHVSTPCSAACEERRSSNERHIRALEAEHRRLKSRIAEHVANGKDLARRNTPSAIGNVAASFAGAIVFVATFVGLVAACSHLGGR